MIKRSTVALACMALTSCSSPPGDREAQVKASVAEFYQNFDDGFTKPADYATEDWYHINPYGGADKGREATLKTVRDVHQSFLKGTKDTIKGIDIRFASDDVAVATVTSETTPFTSPDGVKHGVEGHLRTFVVVKRGNRWLIMQDHNTTIMPPIPFSGAQSVSTVPLLSTQSTVPIQFKHATAEEGPMVEDKDAPGTFGRDVIGSAKTGNWVMYVKFNPGAWANWHWHSNPQSMYIVSGTMNYEVRPHPVMKLTAGSYVVVPGRALHNGTCISKEPCTFFIENILPNDKHMTDANGKELSPR